MTAVKPRTLTDFRAAHDKNVIVPNKIKAALESLKKIGPEHHEYEAEFIKLSGVSQTDMGLFRDQFSEHIVETPAQHGRSSKRVWFADPKVAAKVRG